MDIKPVRFQASFFANMNDVTPTSENISTFLKIFLEKEFLPNIFQEISSEGPKNRVGLISPNNEWMISIPHERIIVQKYLLDFETTNIGTIEVFSNDAIDIFSRILKQFPRKGHRISLISGVVTEIIPDVTMQKTYCNLLKPSKFFKSNNIVGWKTQIAAKKSIKIGKIQEDINAISSFTWLKDNPVLVGILPLFDLSVLHNRVFIDLDINTHQSNLETRFDVNSIKGIYKKFLELNKTISDEWEPFFDAE